MTDDVVAGRADRLRRALAAVGPEALRVGIRTAPEILRRRLHVAARAPYPSLGRHADPWRALARVDAASLQLLADVMTRDCLDAAIETLGSSSDDPSVDELRAAVDSLLAGFDRTTVALMLATVAAGGNPAAAACDEILATDDRLTLPEEPDAPDAAGSDLAATAPPPTRAGPTEEDRARRQARRAAEKEARARERDKQQRAAEARRQRKKDKRPSGPGAVAEAAPSSSPAAAAARPPAPVISRRSPTLAPNQARRFDAHDPLVGDVVTAMVRYHSPDPERPHEDRKRRPCVVIGAARHHLLVRPVYSEGGFQSRQWQSHQLLDWDDAGLDRAGCVEGDAHVVDRHTASDPIGRLSTADWNALW